jgi:hypothetical protein
MEFSFYVILVALFLRIHAFKNVAKCRLLTVTRYMTYSRKCRNISVAEELWGAICRWTVEAGSTSLDEQSGCIKA